MKHNVPVQSLIDHIKTAVDVDPWAKEMVEELLKEQEPVPLIHSAEYEEYWDVENICPKCNARWISLAEDHFCPQCGQAVKWE